MQTVYWQHINVLWALLLVPILYIVLGISVWQNRQFTRQVNPITQRHLLAGASSGQAIVRAILISLLYSVVVLLIAHPKKLVPFGTQQVQNKLLVYVLDVSRSMDGTDVLPTRLLAAKKAIETIRSQVVPQAEALVVFAGNAVVQMPPSTDASALPLYLNAVQTADMPLQGTNIAAALQQALQISEPYTNMGRAIILLSDGENHEPGLPAVMDSMMQAQIPIVGLGFGTAEGATLAGTVTDASGAAVVSKLSAATLEQVAKQSNGMYRQVLDSTSLQPCVQFLQNSAWVTKQTKVTTWASWQPALAKCCLLIVFIWLLVPWLNKRFFVSFLGMLSAVGTFAQNGQTAYQLAQKGFQKQSIVAYENVAKTDSSFETSYNLGTMYLQAKNYTAAQKTLLTASKISPQQFAVWYNAGLAFAGNKQWQQAAACFQKSILIQSNHIQARENLQWVLKQLQNNPPPKPQNSPPALPNAVPAAKVLAYEQEAAKQKKVPANSSKVLEKGW